MVTQKQPRSKHPTRRHVVGWDQLGLSFSRASWYASEPLRTLTSTTLACCFHQYNAHCQLSIKCMHTSASFSTVPGVLFSSVSVDILTSSDSQSGHGKKDTRKEGHPATFVHFRVALSLEHPKTRPRSGSGEPAHARSARAHFARLVCVLVTESELPGSSVRVAAVARPRHSVLVYIEDKLRHFCCIGILLKRLD